MAHGATREGRPCYECRVEGHLCYLGTEEVLPSRDCLWLISWGHRAGVPEMNNVEVVLQEEISKAKSLGWQDLERKGYIGWVHLLEEVWAVVPENGVWFLPLFNCAAIMTMFWNLPELLSQCLSDEVLDKKEALGSGWDQAPAQCWSMEGLGRSWGCGHDCPGHESGV